VGDDAEICEGTTYQLTAPGGSVYAWSTADRSFSSTSPSPVVQPTKTTQYFITVTDANGCTKKDTIQVSVVSKVDLEWQHLIKPNCIDRPTVLVKNLTPPMEGITFRFDFGDEKRQFVFTKIYSAKQILCFRRERAAADL
jgi:hypothetical protein